MKYSSKWKMWKTIFDFKTCLTCPNNHGKIYGVNEIVNPSPPVHPNCRCSIERLKSILAGTATDKEKNGADWYLKTYGVLPKTIISHMNKLLERAGIQKRDLFSACPGKMIFGGIYQNRNGHLPIAPNRIWYEADINYDFGYRGTQRIVFSNDGLIFVTYDHYHTFIEVE